MAMVRDIPGFTYDDLIRLAFARAEITGGPCNIAFRPDADGKGDTALRVAELQVDPAARRAWWTNEELQLSKTEFDLLELLVRNVGIALDHSTVYERIWGYDFGPDSKNLPVYIGYLRRKMEAARAPPLIHTLRGVGYTWREP